MLVVILLPVLVPMPINRESAEEVTLTFRPIYLQCFIGKLIVTHTPAHAQCSSNATIWGS